jgi:hypothetical protein
LGAADYRKTWRTDPTDTSGRQAGLGDSWNQAGHTGSSTGRRKTGHADGQTDHSGAVNHQTAGDPSSGGA